LFKHFKLLIAAQKYNSKELVPALLCLCFLASGGPLSADENNEPEERWFEIEVILYKEITDKGLNNESWDTETPFSLPEELKDFLNPVGPAELSGDTALEQLQTDSTMGKQANDIAPQESVTELDSSRVATTSESASDATLIPAEDELKEQPFILLQQSDLQLQKEAKNISVHPSFRLLAQFAWRQPVAGKSNAMPVRFAGGHDYSEEFEFNGTKKLDLEGQEFLSEALIDSEKQNDIESSELSQYQNQQSVDNAPVQEADSTGLSATLDETSSDIEASEANEQTVLLPWVPEIDGTAKVYIYRNYLHLDADIVFRKPGQLEIDIYSLDTPLNFEDQPLVAPITPMTDELKSLDNSTQNDSQQEMFEQTNQDDQFAWQFDSDFLSQDSEKVYTEKLFNYPLKQTRRMRSTELHYFDHPKIGMLVVIRPYELETDSEELTNDQ
jgi:Peptidoglycan-binding protein, CsiV